MSFRDHGANHQRDSRTVQVTVSHLLWKSVPDNSTNPLLAIRSLPNAFQLVVFGYSFHIPIATEPLRQAGLLVSQHRDQEVLNKTQAVQSLMPHDVAELWVIFLLLLLQSRVYDLPYWFPFSFQVSFPN